MSADELLKLKPYSLDSEEKSKLILDSMIDSMKFHYQNCNQYKSYCDKKDCKPSKINDISQIPFLPVNIFKKINLLSVPETEIAKVVSSSATTSNVPSKISLDKKTITRQMISLNSIMQDFLGKNKLDFVIIDNPDTVSSSNSDLSSRGSAIRGMLIFAKKFNCILNKELKLDSALVSRLNSDNTKKCVFGFTWLIYKIISDKDSSELKNIFKNYKDSVVLHIGGWKKLSDLSVTKEQFNKECADFFNTTPDKVIDLYGMTEQLGIVYPDCKYGHKHVPVYSEVLIRDTSTFDVVGNGNRGFIQVLSPIPNSYPGISLLTDDIGQVLGEDDCKCGRKGKYFVFKKRSEVADPKGCGDTLDI